jgi:hypothetical protein
VSRSFRDHVTPWRYRNVVVTKRILKPWPDSADGFGIILRKVAVHAKALIFRTEVGDMAEKAEYLIERCVLLEDI